MVGRSDLDGVTIDFGAHCHPDDPDENAFAHSFVQHDLDEPVFRDVDALVDQYERVGIDGAVLSQPYYLGHPDLDRTSAANDAMAAAIEGHPNFYGLASIPTAAGGEDAAGEFERCLETGFNGGALETKSAGIELHDPAVEPILEVADRTGAPILVHPKLNESLDPDVLDDTWMLNAIFGREVALIESVCKVVHTGVLDRYPNLNLVYHHNAGNLASTLGRFRSQFDKFPPDRWSGVESTRIKSFRDFKAQIEDRIYLDTSGYDGYNQVLRAALSEFPVSQLLFATDFPFETRSAEDFSRMYSVIEEETSREDASRILGANALQLLVNVN